MSKMNSCFVQGQNLDSCCSEQGNTTIPSPKTVSVQSCSYWNEIMPRFTIFGWNYDRSGVPTFFLMALTPQRSLRRSRNYTTPFACQLSAEKNHRDTRGAKDSARRHDSCGPTINQLSEKRRVGKIPRNSTAIQGLRLAKVARSYLESIHEQP